MTRFALFLLVGVLGATTQGNRGKGRSEDPSPVVSDKKGSETVSTSDGGSPLNQSRSTLGLFKNGYAFYSQTFKIYSDGTYQLAIPSTSHGTLSISSPRNVTLVTRVSTRELQEPADFSSISRAGLQGSLAGQTVTFRTSDNKDTEIRGIVLASTSKDCSSGSTSDVSVSASPRYSAMYPLDNSGGCGSSDFLAVDDGTGITLVDPSKIISIKVQKSDVKVTRQQKVTTVTVTGTGGTETSLLVSYLGYGLTWAPSYQIDVRGDQLRVEFQATVRNEGVGIESQDVSLITGFPNLEFLSSPSLLESSVTDFLNTASRSSYSSSRSQPIFAQQSILSNAYGVESSFEDAKIVADGSDIYYYRIGALSIPAKSAVMKSIDVATTSFNRVVDWDASETDAWDAIRFENPFDAAITTAPATVSGNQSLLGQSSSKWTPPRGIAVIRVSKALSIRVSKSEVQGNGDTIEKVTRIPVTGTLTVSNLRTTPITACIQYTFNGVLQAKPKNATISTADGDALNPATSINWEVPIAASSKLNITYSYIKRQRYYN